MVIALASWVLATLWVHLGHHLLQHSAGVLPPAAFHRGSGQDSAVVFDQVEIVAPGAESVAPEDAACQLKVACSVHALNNIEDTADVDLCKKILSEVRFF